MLKPTWGTDDKEPVIRTFGGGIFCGYERATAALATKYKARMSRIMMNTEINRFCYLLLAALSTSWTKLT